MSFSQLLGRAVFSGSRGRRLSTWLRITPWSSRARTALKHVEPLMRRAAISAATASAVSASFKLSDEEAKSVRIFVARRVASSALHALCDVKEECQELDNGSDADANELEWIESTMDDIVPLMKRSDVVYFGEIHDDKLTHRCQQDLLVRLLSEVEPSTRCLALEQFERDVQLPLQEFMKVRS